jgi:hypothetical protein
MRCTRMGAFGSKNVNGMITSALRNFGTELGKAGSVSKASDIMKLRRCADLNKLSN